LGRSFFSRRCSMPPIIRSPHLWFEDVLSPPPPYSGYTEPPMILLPSLFHFCSLFRPSPPPFPHKGTKHGVDPAPPVRTPYLLTLGPLLGSSLFPPPGVLIFHPPFQTVNRLTSFVFFFFLLLSSFLFSLWRGRWGSPPKFPGGST